MGNVWKLLAGLAKVFAFTGWGLGVIFLVAPFLNGKPVDVEGPLGMAVLGAFWWLLGWGLEKKVPRSFTAEHPYPL